MTTPIDPQQYAAFLAFQQQQAATQQQLPPTFQPATPPPAAVQVSLTDAFNQPSGAYGPSLFKGSTDLKGLADVPGATFQGIVAKQAVAEQQLDFKTKFPKFFQDGRPMVQIKVALDVAPSSRHPEGRATWFLKGEEIGELARAMDAAGVPAELIPAGPEVGAAVQVTYIGDRPNAGGYATKVRQIVYVRPDGAAGLAAAVATAPAVEVPAPVAQVVQEAPAAVQPAPVTPVVAAAPENPVKAALLAKLKAASAAA